MVRLKGNRREKKNRMIGNKEYQGDFLLEENEDGTLKTLTHQKDTYRMNWVEGKRSWGSTIHPDTIEVFIQREMTQEGHLREKYSFQNISQFPVFFQETDLGIYAPFHDDYIHSQECMKKRCHTHLFCGNEGAYVMALRMGGEPPHLGLVLVKGGIASYSVERDLAQRSNDRGDFILHPAIKKLNIGESVEIVWDLFWFTDRKEFDEKLLRQEKFPLIKLEQSTFFEKEEMGFEIWTGGKIETDCVQILCGQEEIPCTARYDGNKTVISCRYQPKKEGEYRFEIKVGEKSTYALLYNCPDLKTMINRRCHFIAEKQQLHEEKSPLDGAYLIYDRDTDQMYYSHLDDHNGGRERLGMGILMASWLLEHKDETLLRSLEQYVEYVYRELYIEETGVVCNDILNNRDWDRLYNYPWMAVFQLELYHLLNGRTDDEIQENTFKKGKLDYLKDALHTVEQYYRMGGHHFYSICMPMTDLYDSLTAEGLYEDADRIRSEFIKHADVIVENGTKYPESEVQYEQSIVSPALDCLLQVYTLTEEKKYLDAASEQLYILELFNGRQPDYHLFENAIRHWDGYWFGKYKNYGDTFPHYWSVLTGIGYAQYAQITGRKEYEDKARSSLRGCLNLFFEDGSASCAMVYPKQVNGKSADYYDPWANDQDWALYFALKFQHIILG